MRLDAAALNSGETTMIKSLFLVSLGLFLAGCDPATPPVASATPPTAASAAPANPPAPAVASVRNVDVATLKADLDGGKVPVLIDVRTPGEYAGGHVPGAKNVPLDELEARIAEFGSADTEVYVICQSGGRSSRASEALAAKGLRPVNVAGGTSAWQAAAFPVE